MNRTPDVLAGFERHTLVLDTILSVPEGDEETTYWGTVNAPDGGKAVKLPLALTLTRARLEALAALLPEPWQMP